MTQTDKLKLPKCILLNCKRWTWGPHKQKWCEWRVWKAHTSI